MKKFLALFLTFCVGGIAASSHAEAPLAGRIFLKTPGNPATAYDLHRLDSDTEPAVLASDEPLPVIVCREERARHDELEIVLTITAKAPIYYSIEQCYLTSLPHEESLFYLPGFWYRRNQRSPQTAPSFRTGASWQVREDRLSAPLTGIFDEHSGDYCTVLRTDTLREESLACPDYGEIILSGGTSLGYTGFRNIEGRAALVFGFPWSEYPKTYVRKLTFGPDARTFEKLDKGQVRQLKWVIRKGSCDSFSSFVAEVWRDAFDKLDPQPVEPRFSSEEAKACLSRYFLESFVGGHPLKYTSGVELSTANPASNGIAEVGFLGRVLLNAFNALEYGEATGNEVLVRNARSIFDSYLLHGFTPNGLFREIVDFECGSETDVYSIRRQSEGICAVLNYLVYEQHRGRSHPEWEARIRTLLDRFALLQNDDGSFPRKFRDDLRVVDASGGSTPSATLPLAMAYVYFGDDDYRERAFRTGSYLEKNQIARADYFSSTLDAYCEDKEASLYAATAMCYLAHIAKDEKQRQRAIALCREAAYFAVSWYYLWDVPFASGQMLGDLHFHSRGWGNVSVENNHIDVFIFEFATVLDWLAETCGEERFARMSAVIRSSMLQLMPVEGAMCGIGRAGYYPEVVQHTAWDYGKNGKGFYNDIFAPGWAVASLWQMLSPERLRNFFGDETN